MTMDMQNWCGYHIWLDVKVIGPVEGHVNSVNTEWQTLSLTCYNKELSKNQLVTVRAKDIKNIKILRTPDKESNKHNGSSNQGADLICHGGKVMSNENTEDHGQSRPRSDSRKGNRKNSERNYKNDKDEICFGEQSTSLKFDHDFDFEKNLALFDKVAVFKKIEGMINTNKAELIPQTIDENRNSRQSTNYRCDENVIEARTVALRQITVPCNVEKEYMTDSGLIVPSISHDLRRKIMKLAEKHGIDETRQLDMIGRAACEMVLQLLGGFHRFMPKNSHQKPCVVVLCGPDKMKNAQAVNCARHLSNHCVLVNLLLCDHAPCSSALKDELALFKMTTGKVLSGPTDLKSISADILISAWGSFPMGEVTGQKELANWISQNKAPIYSIDPDSAGETMQSKWCIVPVLPLPYQNDTSRIYLCDLGIPHEIFSKLGVNYHSPFGHKFVIPLHHKQ